MKYQKVQPDQQPQRISPTIKKHKTKSSKLKLLLLPCLIILGLLSIYRLTNFIEQIEKRLKLELELESQRKANAKLLDQNIKSKEESKDSQKSDQNWIASSLKNEDSPKQPKINLPEQQKISQALKQDQKALEPKPSVSKNFPTSKPITGTRAGITPQHKTQWTKYFKLKNQSLNSEMAKEQKQYYENKYNISQYEELPICIFIPSYNNAKDNRYIHNINSVLQQDYSNYYIVFIDDASDDKTGQLIQQYARKHQISPQKLKIIINAERKMAMPNIFSAAHQHCKPWELFIIVDGDDELVGKQVLKNFNAAFQRQDMWIIYSNFLSFRGTIGYSRQYKKDVIQGNRYRKSSFLISHLRVFYTKLFTLIQEKDLKDNAGLWLRAANDVAMYLPMMEMCHKRLSYIPEISYMYNSNTGLNNHKVKAKEQKSNERMVKTKDPYLPLQNLFTEEELQKLKENKNKKIPVKDLTLPKEQGVETYGWEL